MSDRYGLSDAIVERHEEMRVQMIHCMRTAERFLDRLAGLTRAEYAYRATMRSGVLVRLRATRCPHPGGEAERHPGLPASDQPDRQIKFLENL